jgi:hypothetical protein
MFLQNVCVYLHVHVALRLKGQTSTSLPLSEPRISLRYAYTNLCPEATGHTGSQHNQQLECAQISAGLVYI